MKNQQFQLGQEVILNLPNGFKVPARVQSTDHANGQYRVYAILPNEGWVSASDLKPIK